MNSTPTRNRHRGVTTDRVAEAANSVHAGTYRHGADQISTRSTIWDMLYLLDVTPGMRILELGTGSGYSGELLAHLTGPHGHVVSIDADDTLVRQAQQLHHHTNTQVTVLSTNELEGCPQHSPFDRVIAWTTPPHLPHSWLKQTNPGGIIVSAVKLAPLALAHAILHTTVTNDHTPSQDVSLYPDGFTDMTPTPVPTPHPTAHPALPTSYCDAFRDTPSGTAWLSSPELRKHPGTATHVLADLVTLPARAPIPGWNPAHFRDLLYYLLAHTTGELVTANLPPHGPALGYAAPGIAGLVTLNGYILGSGIGAVRGWITGWQADGSPGMDTLHATLHPEPHGWTPHLQPGEPS